MSQPAEPVHLNNRHRDTLNQIFQHPVSHNVEWHAVVSLFEAVGSVDKHHDGKFVLSVGAERIFVEPPPHKDIDAQTVLDLRRILTAAGYSADTRH
jgi:hypothetical protein